MTDPSPRVDLEDLLREEQWLRTLVARLIGNHADADDVAQSTLLKALDTPPEPWDLRAWLWRVARNTWLMRRREERRRRQRERYAARRESSTRHEDALQLAETRRAVAEAVLELEEPFQATILLVYYLGQSHAHVAELHGVSQNTVYYRLKRAHEILRARLIDDDERSAMVLIAFVAAGPGSTSKPAAAVAPVVGVPALLGLLLLALLVGATALGTSGSAGRVAESRAAQASIRDRQEQTSVKELSSSSAELAQAPRPTAPPEDTIPVVVRNTLTGDPVPGATVLMARKCSGRGEVMPGELLDALTRDPPTERFGRTDADGRVAVPRVALQWKVLWVSAPGFATRWESSHHRVLEDEYGIGLYPAQEATVEILDRNGASVPDLAVMIVGSAADRVATRTDPAGRVRFPWQDLSYRAIIDNEEYRHEAVLGSPTTTLVIAQRVDLRGTIRDAEGRSIPDCELAVRQQGNPLRPAGRSDSSGQFVIRSLNGVGAVKIRVEHDEFATLRIPLGEPPFSALDVELEPRSPNRITGLVRGPWGAPLVGGRARIIRGEDPWAPPIRVAIDDHGRFDFPHTRAGEYIIVIHHGDVGSHPTLVQKTVTNRPLQVEIDMPFGIRASGTVVDEFGDAVPGVGVQVGGRRLKETMYFQAVTSTDTGCITFPSAPGKSGSIAAGWIRPTQPFDDVIARAAEIHGLVLRIVGPYDLLEVNGSPVTGNAAVLLPGEERLDLVVAPRTRYPLLWTLWTQSGQVMRTRTRITASSITSGASMTQLIVHPQNPTFQLVDEPLDRYLFTFRARGYRFCFQRPEPGSWNEFDLTPEPVAANPHRLFVRSADGERRASVAIFFWPVLRDEEPFTHLSLGISDESGEVSEARLLAPGQYELFTTPGRRYRAFDPGEGGPPRYDYRSIGRITWPRDGKPETIEVRLPADDSESR